MLPGPSWTQGMPWYGPSALYPLLCAAKILGFFPLTKGENKALRQMLLHGMLAAGAMLAPW